MRVETAAVTLTPTQQDPANGIDIKAFATQMTQIPMDRFQTSSVVPSRRIPKSPAAIGCAGYVQNAGTEILA
jgi:hypothetical protein